MISKIPSGYFPPTIHAYGSCFPYSRSATRSLKIQELKNSHHLDEQDLHRRLQWCWEMGSKRLPDFFNILLGIETFRIYQHFGFKNIAHYLLETLGCSYFHVQELLRVAHAIRHLPLCQSACLEEKITLPQLLEITKVATPDSEAFWISKCQNLPLSDLQFEVRRDFLLNLPRNENHLFFTHSGGHRSLLPKNLYA